MVIYNPKDWWKLIFAFHKSDTFRMLLPGIIGVAIYTALVSFLENDYFHASFKNTTTVHSLIGFVLSMLLVFRTNSAYDRWWEGRKLWGNLVNSSRNLYLKLDKMIENSEDKIELKNLIIDFAIATKEHLRQGAKLKELSQFSQKSITKSHENIPLQVSNLLYAKVSQALAHTSPSGFNGLLVNEELRAFVDILGGCERIKKTPIPYSYSMFFKKVIFIYIFTMPIGFVREFGYWASPIVALVFYVFAGIELLAEEIEDPFGSDVNDLPTDTICQTIKLNLDQIF